MVAKKKLWEQVGLYGPRWPPPLSSGHTFPVTVFLNNSPVIYPMYSDNNVKLNVTQNLSGFHHYQWHHHQHNQRQSKVMTGGFLLPAPCGEKINQSLVATASTEETIKRCLRLTTSEMHLNQICPWYFKMKEKRKNEKFVKSNTLFLSNIFCQWGVLT